MGDTHGAKDSQRNSRNELSGTVHGPAGQFGDVHGDVNMHWSGAPSSPEEAAFRQRYYQRKLAQWDEEERQAAEQKRRTAEQKRRVAEKKRKEAEEAARTERIKGRRVAAGVGVFFVAVAVNAMSEGGWGILIGLLPATLSALIFTGLFVSPKTPDAE